VLNRYLLQPNYYAHSLRH